MGKDAVFAIHYISKEIVNLLSVLLSKYTRDQKSNGLAKEKMADEL